MSAHADAMRVVVHDFAPHDPWELEEIIKAYLSDLPPSIVVDGRVVELKKANERMLATGTYEDVYTITDLLDAAREVAE